MSKAFDPVAAKESLQQCHATTSGRKRVYGEYDERVFMQVERFTLSRTGEDEWAIGHSITDPKEKIMVRLSSVQERMLDVPRANEAKLRQSYEGENRRQNLAEKAHGKIKFIAFDGARLLGVSDDGTKQYRAHWPQSMVTSPQAEVCHGLGSIVLYQPKDGANSSKADAYVEFLRTATSVDGSNVRQAIEAAIELTDSNGRARDGHALMRVFYKNEEVATARIFAAREQGTVSDPLYGDDRTIMRAIDAQGSFQALRDGISSGIKAIDANNDLARAIIAGLLGDEVPPKSNLLEPEQAENFFHGAKSGSLAIEITGVERIRFGVDTSKTYLKDRENKKFADYLVKTNDSEGRTSLERGYGNTVVALQRYPDGQPYAVYASPQENLPRVSPLAHFDSKMPLTSILPPESRAAKLENSNEKEVRM